MAGRFIAAACAAWCGAAAALAQPLPSPAPMLADAELTSVCFVDADHGWAVGDRGVIWHTADGGRNWQLQPSPTACRLESVTFIDSLHGWAAGGWTHPYTHHTSGIILRTRDGGRSWQAIPEMTLPALKQIKFLDHRRGWAIGDASPMYPSGVFRTGDGGREWTPVPRGTTLGWLAGDFRDEKSGVVAGRGNQTAIALPGEVRPSRSAAADGPPLRRMALSGQGRGWLAGDDGLVLTTQDGGANWHPPRSPLPDVMTKFDFRALAALGLHVWMAGNPGTIVFYSPDGGLSWNAFRTDQPLPIHALHFIDEHRGWAVGALGTILATRDGGRTWRMQRSGGARAALVAVFADPARLPLEVFAQQSASEGYLGVAEILCHGGAAGGTGARAESIAERTHQAVVAAGGSHAETCWRLPLPHREIALTTQAVMEQWNAAAGGRAAELLQERLVRSIRTWRPEVIITEDVSPRGDDPLAHVTNQLVLAAVERAADPAACPEQLVRLGLAPWEVKKVFGVQPRGRQGTVNVSPSQWSAPLARSLADVAESGRSLLLPEVRPAPPNVALSLLVDRLPQNTGRRDIFSGLVVLPGGEARRPSIEPAGGDLEKLARAAQRRHNVEQLLARVERDPSQGAALLAQMSELTEGIGPRGAGELLFQLARRYQLAGQGEAAAEAMQFLLNKHPQHPLADAAALWLVQHYSSGEAALRAGRPHKFPVQQAAATKEGPQPPISLGPGALAGSVAAAAPGPTPAERAAKALAVARQIERTRPAIASDPAFRFPLLAARRKAAQENLADNFLSGLAAGSAGAWGKCAAAELSLLQGRGQTAKPVIACVTAAQRPRLDGRLDDEVWKGAKPVVLTGLAAEGDDHPAQVVFAFDEEFLFVAASCRKAAGGNYTPDDAPRTHDAHLTPRDRVELHIDIDRDYASYWTLAVDCRGFTADRLLGDATWNPSWFVASGGDDIYWTAELAVPLAELCPKPPQVRDAWAVGIQRIIPNRGFQSATQPASVDVQPEGFGLLVFE
jgi:photosystem II stability/assembly factor-like uncharacterized protein